MWQIVAEKKAKNERIRTRAKSAGNKKTL